MSIRFIFREKVCVWFEGSNVSALLLLSLSVVGCVRPWAARLGGLHCAVGLSGAGLCITPGQGLLVTLTAEGLVLARLTEQHTLVDIDYAVADIG